LFGEEPPDLIAERRGDPRMITRTPDQARDADVLAKVHTWVDDVDVAVMPRLRFTAPRVIVGAPIFIREPAARPWSHAAG
jgi:hypothetical protein